MGDEELVKRLWDTANSLGADGRMNTADLVNEAAYRIKALQAEVEKLRGELIGREMVRQDHARIAQLEAELAGAREKALEEAAKVARDYGSKAKLRGWTTASDSAAKAAQHIARTIRALKDHPHDV